MADECSDCGVSKRWGRLTPADHMSNCPRYSAGSQADARNIRYCSASWPATAADFPGVPERRWPHRVHFCGEPLPDPKRSSNHPGKHRCTRPNCGATN